MTLPAEEPGFLRVGVDIDYRPYSYVDPSGDPSGFDIELMELLAERLGLSLEVKTAPWKNILDDLREKRIDVAAGALFTISRTDHFIFTEPYNTDIISIFVRKRSSIDSLKELSEKKAAILEGDAIPETVLNTSGIKPDIISYPRLSDALMSVSKGTADFCLAPYAVGVELLKSTGIKNLKVAGPPVYTIQYRLALHQSQEGFRDQLNKELAALVETEAYRDLRDKWLLHQRRELSFETVAGYTVLVLIPILVLLLIVWVWTLKRQVTRQTKELEQRSAEFKAQATRDELTGLANRRFFDSIAEREFSLSQRRGREIFAVLFMDLDHFKAVNDTYGHSAGDTVLREFAARACGELRGYDILARYGGEEFAVLLRDADLSRACSVAGRIREACLNEDFRIDTDNRSIRVTISIGVAVQCPDDRSFQDVMARADKALYRAKSAGRNQVISC